MNTTLARTLASVRKPRRSGYTLLELMLVLAVLTVIVAMAWPSLSKPLHRSAVEQAAGQLVKDLGQARLAAIESGQIIRFRYEPGGGRYVLDMASAAVKDGDSSGEEVSDAFASDELDGPGSDSSQTDKELSSVETFSAETSRSNGGRQREARPAWSLRGELPTDVVFRDPAEVSDEKLPPGSAMSDMLADEATEREEVKPLIDQGGEESDLSPPVFLYPNGRAENAELVLVGPEEYRIVVRLRGLTGAASLGPLEHPERDYTERDRAGREDANRWDQDRMESTQESPWNGDSNRRSTERTPSSAPRAERSTSEDPPRVTRESD